MKALVFREELEFIRDYPDPTPVEGEALIKVLMAGICSTDIEVTKGYMDFRGILGHEFVGRVKDVVGKGRDLIGQRIVGEINCGCGDCQYCEMAMSRHCTSRTVLGISLRDGCFAEYITLPVENMHPIPEALSDEEATFSEPAAAAFEILEQVQICPDDRVLVVGDGKLGLIISQVIKSKTAHVTQAGKHPKKLQIASQRGVKTLLVTNLGDEFYDVVIEATGSESGLKTSLHHTRPRGIIVLKSTLASRPEVDTAAVVVNELTIVGSRCGPFAPALHALEHLVDVRPLISATYPFDRALEAFAYAEKKETLKVLLDMREKKGKP